jgi:hypothetical protein
MQDSYLSELFSCQTIGLITTSEEMNMAALQCRACKLWNVEGETVCSRCGTDLKLIHGKSYSFAPEQTIDLSKAEPLIQGVQPGFPCWSFWGCGSGMLFYSRIAEGLYETTQWITIAGMPVIPLSTWVISPVAFEVNRFIEGSFKEHFTVHGRRPFSAVRVLRMYALALGAFALCLGPLVVAFLLIPRPAPGGKESPLGLLYIVFIFWALLAKIFIVDRIAVDPYDKLRKEAIQRNFSN